MFIISNEIYRFLVLTICFQMADFNLLFLMAIVFTLQRLPSGFITLFNISLYETTFH
ncbi:hypothetical protein KT99_19764 [Shewanella benthica KT99]|uniref:Uncharacterized protein n=1 Tax=Shewanella benthica KT99 TaxID=314608 RepID=A9D066_9GAMM|nr:hypothetical protein KT99_19764 [Shewanella benthica KT99]